MSWDLGMIDTKNMPSELIIKEDEDKLEFLSTIYDYEKEWEKWDEAWELVHPLIKYERHKFWSEGGELRELILNAMGANPVNHILKISWDDTNEEIDNILSRKWTVGNSNDPYIFRHEYIKKIYDHIESLGNIKMLDVYPRSQSAWPDDDPDKLTWKQLMEIAINEKLDWING